MKKFRNAAIGVVSSVVVNVAAPCVKAIVLTAAGSGSRPESDGCMSFPFPVYFRLSYWYKGQKNTIKCCNHLKWVLYYNILVENKWKHLADMLSITIFGTFMYNIFLSMFIANIIQVASRFLQNIFALSGTILQKKCQQSTKWWNMHIEADIPFWFLRGLL